MKTQDAANKDPNTCSAIEQAAAYCLDELPAADRAAYSAHLAACAVCRARVQSFSGLVEHMREQPERDCSPELTEKIMSVVRGQTRNAPLLFRRSRFTPALAYAAAILLLLTLSVTVFLVVNPPLSVETDQTGKLPSAVTAKHNAIKWLCDTQEKDGGWQTGEQANYRVGISSLAILALLNDDSPDTAAARRNAIARGTAFLIKQQDAKGLFGPKFSGATYNQGLATLALVSADAAESNASYRVAAKSGIGFIVDQQDSSGGWSYLQEGPGSVNTSASVWPIVALLRAREAGYENLGGSIERGIRWLHGTVNPSGLMGYHRMNEAPSGFDTLTAAGALCLLKNRARPDSPIVASMLPSLHKTASNADVPVDFYRSFFLSQALSLTQEPLSEKSLKSISDRILSMQKRSGPAAGSWPAVDQWGTTGGPVYATALASMTIRRR